MLEKELSAIGSDYDLEIVDWEKREAGYKLLTDKGKKYLLVNQYDLLKILESTGTLRPNWLIKPWQDRFGSFWGKSESGDIFFLTDWQEIVPADWQKAEQRRKMTKTLAEWHEKVMHAAEGTCQEKLKIPQPWWEKAKGVIALAEKVARAAEIANRQEIKNYWQKLLAQNCPGIDDYRQISWSIGDRGAIFNNYAGICCCIPPLEIARWLELNGWMWQWQDEVLLEIWSDYIECRNIRDEEISLLQAALIIPRKIALGFARYESLAHFEEKREIFIEKLVNGLWG
ncbi:hypothetical protein SAMN02745885_02204 [Carboxydocella sporoproducens DSM 16521]|uniref:Uncharacterized protein n=2 Tax=Carboxydocella TaxID=178898 RepID=A0A1T4RNU3_9FIRM|nr:MULTISPECIES: hypothetical protein [Carboxydocella]AVX20431.1 hypothetical protein CFE_1241 [Carboxydocella thermautotrophica]SKA17603.1 hypothetical protein SAMN02745885_02204 [Carboxydocella sporoproducens DSM 16521]